MLVEGAKSASGGGRSLLLSVFWRGIKFLKIFPLVWVVKPRVISFFRHSYSPAFGGFLINDREKQGGYLFVIVLVFKILIESYSLFSCFGF